MLDLAKKNNYEVDSLETEIETVNELRNEKAIPVVGFAISFPGTDSKEDLMDAVEYIVNRKYVEEELEGYMQDEVLNNDAN